MEQIYVISKIVQIAIMAACCAFAVFYKPINTYWEVRAAFIIIFLFRAVDNAHYAYIHWGGK